jgi:hypothetical protein
MGISDQPGRPKLLVWLGGFVVVFGVVAWLVTGGANRVPPSSHGHPPTFTLRSTPTPSTSAVGPRSVPLGCMLSQTQLIGAFSACTSIDRASRAVCEVSPHSFKGVFKLLGGSHTFLLYLNIPVRYPEPGNYTLSNGGAEVDVREAATGGFWQSVSGVLTTTSLDGRSGTVSAVLEAAASNNTVLPGATLRVDGPWSCL